VKASLQELEALSEQSRPDLRAQEVLVERAGRRVGLEKAQMVPDLTLGGGYKRDFGIHSYYAGASLPLPLFDRNQGTIGAAEAELRSAQNQLLWKRLLVRSEVETAYHNYGQQKNNFDRLQGDVLKKAQEVLEITHQSYQEGEADLIDYLDALRTSLDTRLLYHDLLQQLHEAHVQLEAAVGTNWNKIK
jgi:cobalt-zinc-cadmium efflux system outer membrane protein